MSGPDPQRARDRPPACDSSKGMVAADVVAGSALALGGLVAIGENAGGEAAIPIAAAAAFFLAAGRGNSVANDCRAAIETFTDFMAERREVEPPRRAAGAAAGAARARPPGMAMPGAPSAPAVTPAAVREPEDTDEPAIGPAVEPPRPAPVARPVQPKPTKPPPAPAPAPAEDPWGEFWKEVP